MLFLTNKKVEQVVYSIQSEFLTIDTTPLLGKEEGTSWTAPYDQFQSVQDLLNSIYLSLPQDRIKQYTYGKTWHIKDAQSGKIFDEIGGRAGARRMGFIEDERLLLDERSLSEVGIKPGMRLEVIKPR